MRLRRRHRCGAGALLGVLLLAAFAGGALAYRYEAQAAVRARALDRAAGRAFASWFLAAHRASQEHAAAFAARLAAGEAVTLAPADLRALGAVPPGLPAGTRRGAGFVFGVIADGTPRGVPMAFGVLEPDADGGAARATAMREGALDGGLADMEPEDGPLMGAPHLAAIEAALGREAADGALVVTADRGLRYLETALYRRAQPGRAYLNRLETGLDMSTGGAEAGDVSGAAAVSAGAAVLSGASSAVGTANAGAAVSAAGLAAREISAREFDAAGLALSGDLTVGRATAGSTAIGSAVVSGRFAAGGLNTAGTFAAGPMSSATSVAVVGTLAATGDADAGEAAVSGLLGAGSLDAGAVRGPDAGISGVMAVGSCAGC